MHNAYFFSEMETTGWNESSATENSDGSSVARGKSCMNFMSVVEDKDMKDHWFVVHFLTFSNEDLRPKMETDHLKVIVKLGLEFEYLKPLLFSFHCLMTLILPHWSNWPIYPYSIFHPLLKISQNISVKKEKNTKKVCLLYQSLIKKPKNLCHIIHWPSLMPPEVKVFISNSPWGSKYHLTLSFFLLWQSLFLTDHILLKLSTFSSNKIQLYEGTHPGLPPYSKQFTRVGKCTVAMKGFILPIENSLPFFS